LTSACKPSIKGTVSGTVGGPVATALPDPASLVLLVPGIWSTRQAGQGAVMWMSAAVLLKRLEGDNELTG